MNCQMSNKSIDWYRFPVFFSQAIFITCETLIISACWSQGSSISLNAILFVTYPQSEVICYSLNIEVHYDFAYL